MHSVSLEEADHTGQCFEREFMAGRMDIGYKLCAVHPWFATLEAVNFRSGCIGLQQLRRKFETLAGAVLPPDRIARIIEVVHSLKNFDTRLLTDLATLDGTP